MNKAMNSRCGRTSDIKLERRLLSRSLLFVLNRSVMYGGLGASKLKQQQQQR
jgi:hypothetical protein